MKVSRFHHFIKQIAKYKANCVISRWYGQRVECRVSTWVLGRWVLRVRTASNAGSRIYLSRFTSWRSMASNWAEDESPKVQSARARERAVRISSIREFNNQRFGLRYLSVHKFPPIAMFKETTSIEIVCVNIASSTLFVGRSCLEIHDDEQFQNSTFTQEGKRVLTIPVQISERTNVMSTSATWNVRKRKGKLGQVNVEMRMKRKRKIDLWYKSSKW